MEIDITKPELYQLRSGLDVVYMFKQPNNELVVIYTEKNGWINTGYRDEFGNYSGTDRQYDIILKPVKKPWADLKDGDPCIVSGKFGPDRRRVFSREINGHPYTYIDGNKFTSNGQEVFWDSCRPPTKEELES